MTVLVVTFTYHDDEDLARFGAKSVQTLRNAYPQHKIIHYLIDDKNIPFETPFEDEGDTHYIQTDFPRNGNLTGLKAFRGEVATMDKLVK